MSTFTLTIIRQNPAIDQKERTYNCPKKAGSAIVSVIFFATIFFQHAAVAQNKVIQDKIDPVFRSMINLAKERAVNKNAALPARYSILPTEGFALKSTQPEKRYECIVYTKNTKALTDSGIIINSALPGFVTAWATMEQIIQMSLMPLVTYIRAPRTDHLHNDIVVGGSGASLLHQGKLNNTIYKGKNVIIAIYDTGIDWDHLDFRDPNDTTKSRILRIWDQTLTAVAGEAPPSGFAYGVEYTQGQINDELDGSPANIVRERDRIGHGTHVTGTAAGNGASLPSRRYTGMAPEADIVVVKGSDNEFSESRMIDGLTYVKNLATTLGKPVVLNWSIGGQEGAHDGSRSYEVAVDDFTASAPGRVVVISAGNDNGKNIHNRVLVPANGSGSVSISVPDATSADVFEYRLYANDSSDLTATITAPDGNTVTAIAGITTIATILSDSFTVYLQNGIDPDNNLRYVDAYLARSNVNTRRPTGIWTLSVTNNTGKPLTTDGWLYYKNDAFVTTNIIGGNSEFLVSSPGNAGSAITTASFNGKNSRYSNVTGINYSGSTVRADTITSESARGPRRDGVLKPDIAADGQYVISCLSSNAVYLDMNIAEKGLYVKDQGTSMAAPGVTGAAALLLQANPLATAIQIKGYLTAAANKDVMTELKGATPNATWGYGKLDVFKAASLLFNCAPANRITYKYDSSTVNSQENGLAFNTQKLAVRFTPDQSGKLGGMFFHTSGTTTALFAEVRTNNSGVPGTLLGTINIDSGRIGRYAMNYIDLSILNIPVTSGTDYFIVLARAPTSTASWSLRAESLEVSGRSLQSINSGVTWVSPATPVDYKIRSVVYTNAQIAGNIATLTSTDARDPRTSNQFINADCQLISQVVPAGINPVTGTVTSKVWLQNRVPYHLGNPYVQRHYEIAPASDAAAATGRVTLYFTQAEFTDFNNDPLSFNNLPAGPDDAVGIANLKIGTYTGTSGDNSGLPASYSLPAPVIDPADGDIVWNASASRWEVSFDATGFSGFIVQSVPTAFVLPIVVEYFKGNTQGAANILNWKINCFNSLALFDVERSDNGNVFSSISTLSSTAASCSLPFTFKDDAPLPGANYYRVKITDNTGKITYTNTILLQSGTEIINRLYPTVMSRGTAVQVSFSGIKGTLTIYDAVGRQILTKKLLKGVQIFNLELQGSQLYFYTIEEYRKILSDGKIIFN